jgi:putative pyruvate formate lyase activating enzyme
MHLGEEIYTDKEIKLLSHCTLCPRDCRVNRFQGGGGYCGMDAGMNVASVCIHRGEEPVISGPDGICNIFFAGCNLHCIYCQNHEISRPGYICRNHISSINEILDTIASFMRAGIKAVGFVSPSHVVPQVKAIIRGIQLRGLKPVYIYNTNSYDKAEVINELDGLIDVYLPDYKYVTSKIAVRYSDAPDYPQVALKAIKKMYYQKGSALHLDKEGMVENGLLIRHLVLPGHSDESIKTIQSIAEELSTGVHISLMSQYHPTDMVKEHPLLGRRLYVEEYESVVKEMERLGFRNGWIQDLESYKNYLPDFSKKQPFE